MGAILRSWKENVVQEIRFQSQEGVFWESSENRGKKRRERTREMREKGEIFRFFLFLFG